jgi:hypothetical protein
MLHLNGTPYLTSVTHRQSKKEFLSKISIDVHRRIAAKLLSRNVNFSIRCNLDFHSDVTNATEPMDVPTHLTEVARGIVVKPHP